MLEYIAKESIDIEKILLTHAHIDHAGSTKALAEELGVPVIGPHKEDEFLIQTMEMQGKMFGLGHAESFVPTEAMLRGDFSTFNSLTCGRNPVVMRGGFVNNRIDPSALSPAALAISKFLPKAQDECGRVQYERTRPTLFASA